MNHLLKSYLLQFTKLNLVHYLKFLSVKWIKRQVMITHQRLFHRPVGIDNNIENNFRSKFMIWSLIYFCTSIFFMFWFVFDLNSWLPKWAYEVSNFLSNIFKNKLCGHSLIGKTIWVASIINSLYMMYTLHSCGITVDAVEIH